MSNNNAKVLVGCPTYIGMKYCLSRFLERVKNLSYNNYEILIVDNSDTDEYYNLLSKEEGITVIKDNFQSEKPLLKVINSRNKIINYALENNFDYILMLDQDVIPTTNIIEELLKENKDLISGLYYNHFMVSGKMKTLPVAWTTLTDAEFDELKSKISLPPSVKSVDEIPRHLTAEEIKSKKILEVFHPSAGAMLISKNVFSKIDYSLNQASLAETNISDDVIFIRKARKAGFVCYCNTSVLCDHLLAGKYISQDGKSFKHPFYK